jgi:hypothetical protein
MFAGCILHVVWLARVQAWRSHAREDRQPHHTMLRMRRWWPAVTCLGLGCLCLWQLARRAGRQDRLMEVFMYCWYTKGFCWGLLGLATLSLCAVSWCFPGEHQALPCCLHLTVSLHCWPPGHQLPRSVPASVFQSGVERFGFERGIAGRVGFAFLGVCVAGPAASNSTHAGCFNCAQVHRPGSQGYSLVQPSLSGVRKCRQGGLFFSLVTGGG